MPDNKHTPEPWAIDQDDRPNMHWNNHIVSEANPNITICFMAHDGTELNECGEANARRVVACVNACEGIPTDALERSKSLDEFMRSMKVIEQQRDSFKDAAEYNKRRAEDAEKQRDELLAALNRLYVACPTTIDCQHFHHSKREQHSYLEPCGPAGEYLAAIEQSRAAIASVKGEQ